MKTFKIISAKTITFISLMLLIVACEEPFSEDIPEDSNWYANNWKRINYETYLNLEGTYPLWCSPSLDQGVVTFSKITWLSSSVGQFTAYSTNSSRSATFQIEQEGDYMIVSPIDEQTMQTHNPTTYAKSSGWCQEQPEEKLGEGLFWTAKDFGCGKITVYVDNGYAGTISSYYQSKPDCGASGCVTITKDPGTYGFTAQCGNYTWNGSISIYENGCSSMQLK